MIAIFLLIILCIIIIPLLVKGFIFMVFILLPTIIGIYLLTYFNKKRKYNKMKSTIDSLTSKESLKKLKPEEKKRLARIVDLYLHNYKAFKQTFKDDLLWAGIGYAAASMGVERAARVGIGYTVVRKYLKPTMRQALEHKTEED